MRPLFLFIAAIVYSLSILSCQYKYPEKYDPSKIRLCVSNRWVPWLNSSIGMVHENTTIFCDAGSLVHSYFSLVKLSIPHYGEIQTTIIEDSCDMVISVTNGVYFYQTYGGSRSLPLVLVYPNNSQILLNWSDKKRWKQWMISNGFGNYVAKPVDLKRPLQYPFILKEGLSEGSKGVTVVQNATQLQAKLAYFKEKNITNYYGEEALTGMGRAQGIFYVSAFEGKVLNIQCYLHIVNREDIRRQNFSGHIFIAGRPLHVDPVRGYMTRVQYDVGTADTIRKITKKGMYTGIYCAEFKMNRFKQIVFMEFNARICVKLTQKDAYFVEAYLPLAFSLHRFIRTLRPPSRRLHSIIARSHVWYGNKSMLQIARGFHMHSSVSIVYHNTLPTLSHHLFAHANMTLDAL